jgi:hypothetical protein
MFYFLYNDVTNIYSDSENSFLELLMDFFKTRNLESPNNYNTSRDSLIKKMAHIYNESSADEESNIIPGSQNSPYIWESLLLKYYTKKLDEIFFVPRKICEDCKEKVKPRSIMNPVKLSKGDHSILDKMDNILKNNTCKKCRCKILTNTPYVVFHLDHQNCCDEKLYMPETVSDNDNVFYCVFIQNSTHPLGDHYYSFFHINSEWNLYDDMEDGIITKPELAYGTWRSIVFYRNRNYNKLKSPDNMEKNDKNRITQEKEFLIYSEELKKPVENTTFMEDDQSLQMQ